MRAWGREGLGAGGIGLLLCLAIAACGGGTGGSAEPLPDQIAADPLQPDEVAAIMNAAARALEQQIAVAVTDRRGVVLGVGTNFGTSNENEYRQFCIDTVACPYVDEAPAFDCETIELAVQLARTAAIFSADQTPLTSRSIRFLSGEHFPPGVKNTGAAALFGVENTNRGCSFDTTEDPEPLADLLPRPKSLSAQLREPQLPCDSRDASPSNRCGCSKGIATVPGGVPIYKNGRMSGGIGVAALGRPPPDPVAAADDPMGILRKDPSHPSFEWTEFAARAFAGDDVGIPTLRRYGLINVCDATPAPSCCTAAVPCTFGILPAPPPLPFDPVIFVDGIEIPEVELKPRVIGVGSGEPLREPFIVPPTAGAPAPSGWLIAPRGGTDAQPLAVGEVEAIINAGIAEADRIRAAIRLPLKARTKMVLAITDTNGALLGVFRMNDATVFSIDVAIAKARNVSYFSSDQIDPTDTLDCPGPLTADCDDQFFSMGCVADANDCTAITNRTIGFGSQPFFPSGIDGSRPGPFRRIFIDDSALPCTNAGQPSNGRQNGVVFFPGSAPLYKDGVLAGGLGVSGDGVEQDDIVTFAATRAAPGFEPAAHMRADQLHARGVRLPYFKFNRQPGQ